MEQDITDRLELILKAYELSPSGFSDKIQIQRSAMSHIFSRRNRPSLDVIQKVLKCFPEINSNWLLFGIGKMKQLNLFGEEDAPELPKKNVELPVSTGQEDSVRKHESSFTIPDDFSASIESKRVAEPTLYNYTQERPHLSPVNFPPEDKEKREVIQEYAPPEKFGDERKASASYLTDRLDKQVAQEIIEKKVAEKKEKEIARIVIFYTDKTFSVHLPE